MHRNHELNAAEDVTTTQGVAWGYNDRPYYGIEMPDGMGELFTYDKAALSGWLRRAANAVDALPRVTFSVHFVGAGRVPLGATDLDSYATADRLIKECVARPDVTARLEDFEVHAYADGVEMRQP